MDQTVIISESHDFQRLVGLIQTGNCVLFLGAGVSIDSGAPSGWQLANELGKAFFGVEPGTYSLDAVCGLIDANDGRKALNEWLLARFDGLRPSGALLSIPRLRWRSIYTVNIDTLLEGAYETTSGRLQELVPFYSNKDPLSRLRPDNVPLYKLHGCLSRANSEDGRLVMSQDDFANVQDTRQRLYNRLFDDVSDSTLLYVGFSRQDQDFTRILLSVERAAGHLGLRRAYALQPTFSEPERRLWEGKRVTLLPIGAREFFSALEAHVPQEQRYITVAHSAITTHHPIMARKQQLTEAVLTDIERSFEIIDERVKEQEPNTSEFFLGSQPNWGAVSRNVSAPRDLRDPILEAVLRDPLLDRLDVQFVLVHAEAGTGKTTLLKQIALELAFTWDRVVVALKPYGTVEFLDLERLARDAQERIYVIIDDASGMARELSELISTARRAKSKITVLAAARTNEWHEAQENYSFDRAEEFELDSLSRVEIDAIIKVLTEHGALGLLAGMSHESQVATFESRAQKQLLVALREATEGRAFDEIVVDEYDRIPSPDGQRAYLLVAALHRLGISTRVSLLHRALNIPFDELRYRVFEPTMKVIVTREVLGGLEHYYSTRHQQIAEIVFDRKIGTERRRLDYYSEVIGHLDLGYSSDADAYRKLTRGKNKQLLRDFHDPESRRELMDKLIRVDPSDAFAQQHAAMMELDQGNLQAAAHYLNKAIALRPGDASIRDTEGLLALYSAESETDPIIADAKFATAEELFERNIERRPEEPFGYRHLAETYVAWSARPADIKRTQLLRLAYQTLLRGLDKCTSKSMLLQYQGELEQKFGNPGKAREAFARALEQKPGDMVTRLMAAKLEERAGCLTDALRILEQGLDSSPADAELHLRIALLMARVQPERDTEIRTHFQASVLGPKRNYLPRLAYGAYLFSRKQFDASSEQFRQLDNVLVGSRERFDVRRFPFGMLCDRHIGRIRRLSFDFGFVEFAQGAVDIFFSPRQLPYRTLKRLDVGRRISFEIGFNLKGQIATDVRVEEA